MSENKYKYVSSVQNEEVKDVVKLRKRQHRDEEHLLLIEGYRELLRAVENGCKVSRLYFCEALFLGENERSLIRRCERVGCTVVACSEKVFRKMAYRDRPDGLLALAPQVGCSLEALTLGDVPFVLIAVGIEKPGNLGTILRSADAAGVDAVIVCDQCTDINNPNVVRASIGTLFSVQVAEASTPEVFGWLREHGITVLAATPNGEEDYTQTAMDIPLAIAVGSEMCGLEPRWMKGADRQVVIPMMGQADSLNVASAATIMLYEALRQRRNTSPKSSIANRYSTFFA